MLMPSTTPQGVLILLVYYNRPILVKNALRSVLDSHENHPHWHLAVLDDGSESPAEPIVREIMHDHLENVSFYSTSTTFEEKKTLGITVGKIANQAIRDSDLPIVVTLCDDDELHPLYAANLSRFFSRRLATQYCYSHLLLYNPLTQSSSEAKPGGPYNQWTHPIECYHKVDGSQVAFRASCMKEHDIWYEESTGGLVDSENTFLANLDGELFKQFYDKFGPAHYTGFVSQFKGVHEYQMVFLKEHVIKGKEGMDNYHKEIVKLSGTVF